MCIGALLHLYPCSEAPADMAFSVCVVRGDSNVKGTITFEQDSESAPTKVSWDITGHDPNAKRGMHIHTFGDNTNGCTSAGPHCEYPLMAESDWGN